MLFYDKKTSASCYFASEINCTCYENNICSDLTILKRSTYGQGVHWYKCTRYIPCCFIGSPNGLYHTGDEPVHLHTISHISHIEPLFCIAYCIFNYVLYFALYCDLSFRQLNLYLCIWEASAYNPFSIYVRSIYCDLEGLYRMVISRYSAEKFPFSTYMLPLVYVYTSIPLSVLASSPWKSGMDHCPSLRRVFYGNQVSVLWPNFPIIICDMMTDISSIESIKSQYDYRWLILLYQHI